MNGSRSRSRVRGALKALRRRGLWYSVFGPRPIDVIIAREPADSDGYRIALISTDIDADTAAIIARYNDRWSIEVCFQDAKQTVGVGQARNRVQRAVERTVPFGLLCQSLAIAWYALNANPAADVERRRRAAPWYTQKRDPAMLDILSTLRRELIRAEFHRQAGQAPTPAKITHAAPPHLQEAA